MRAARCVTGCRAWKGLSKASGWLVLLPDRARLDYPNRDALRNLFVVASQGFTDDVVMPCSTRRRVAMRLRKPRDKQLEKPWKKRDQIPQ